ncbi:MAG: hypothetical protein U9N86_04975 [Bacteroidota bacterium]|nr:hypothetical protein [Bacteroidota bacterium]
MDKTVKGFAENKPEVLEQVKLISEGLSNNSNPYPVHLLSNPNLATIWQESWQVKFSFS